MPKISSNKAEFYFELQGQGQPLILISGYTCDHQFWEPVIGKLSESFQILTFDNRGVGQTQDSNEELSIELMANDVVALAEALQLTKPHIVGHSMGGCIAQQVAALHGDKINKLGILSSSLKWRLPTLLGLQSHIKLREMGIDFNVLMDTALPWIYGQEFFQNALAVAQLRNDIANNPFPQSIENQKRQFQALEKYNAEELPIQSSIETLICWGKEDIVASPIDMENIVLKFPKSQKVELPRAAHGLIDEVSEDITNVLTNFLKN